MRCLYCNMEFYPSRSDARFCSSDCRVGNHRHGSPDWGPAVTDKAVAVAGDGIPEQMRRFAKDHNLSLEESWYYMVDRASAKQTAAVTDRAVAVTNWQYTIPEIAELCGVKVNGISTSGVSVEQANALWGGRATINLAEAIKMLSIPVTASPIAVTGMPEGECDQVREKLREAYGDCTPKNKWTLEKVVEWCECEGGYAADGLSDAAAAFRNNDYGDNPKDLAAAVSLPVSVAVRRVRP